MTGTVYDAIIKDLFLDAEHYYFNTTTDLLSALLSHKIDAAVEDEEVLYESKMNNPEITIIGEPVSEMPIAFAFPKNEKGNLLLRQMNEFITEVREGGMLDELKEKWADYESGPEMKDYTTL